MKPLLRAAVALSLSVSSIAAAALTVLTPAAAEAQARRTAPQRGDYLPPDVVKSGPNVDYAAQHLRRPPAGYGWFSLGGVFVMASVSTGLIVEVVS